MEKTQALKKFPAAFLTLLLASGLSPDLNAQDNSAHQRPAVASDDRITSGPPVLAREEARYRLCKGDLIDLKFESTPEFNQTVTVQPDGYVTLIDLGDLQVEGQTVPELTRRLEKQYARIINSPQITVVLKQFTRPTFSALGELAHPGQYELKEDISIIEAIALAGGFSESAKHSQVILLRSASEEWVEVRQIDVKKMLAKPTLTGDVRIKPGDIVFVPRSTLSKLKAFIPRAGVSLVLRPRVY